MRRILNYAVILAVWGMELLARDETIFKASLIPIHKVYITFYLPLSLAIVAIANVAIGESFVNMKEFLR